MRRVVAAARVPRQENPYWLVLERRFQQADVGELRQPGPGALRDEGHEARARQKEGQQEEALQGHDVALGAPKVCQGELAGIRTVRPAAVGHVWVAEVLLQRNLNSHLAVVCGDRAK